MDANNFSNMRGDAETVQCDVCPHRCLLKPGQRGLCRGRINKDGRILPDNYGRLTVISMDPIEKKPFARFFPGSEILSVGSYGCNLSCPFCQNYSISQVDSDSADWREMAPEELADLALSIRDNLGIAFTYNEPLIAWEYIRDTAKILKTADPSKQIALVSNGMANAHVIESLLPWIDAANIDVKGDNDFYRKSLGGDLDTVKKTVELLVPSCHVEITTLLIPGCNDSEEWIRKETAWLASLDPDIPLHLTRYFPRYHCQIPATPRDTILRLKKVAEEKLHYVYAGNM